MGARAAAALRKPRQLQRARSVALLGACIVLAGCASSVSGTAASAGSPAFTGCDKIACTGTLHGARYEIALPQRWNGTLLLYSHGYREPGPSEDRSPVLAPGWDTPDQAVGKALLERGYALAGSGFSAQGWNVAEGVSGNQELYEFFRSSVGVPQRVYAWGDSLGGLITQMLAQGRPSWLSAAAPVCAPLAGLVPNFDLGLDLEFAVQTLIYPGFQISGLGTAAAARRQLLSAAAAIANARSPGRQAAIAYIAATVGTPGQTPSEDGATRRSLVAAYAESIINGLALATVARYGLEQRFGGNVSGNTTTNYARRISGPERELIDSFSPGATARFNAAMAAGPRVAASPPARARALESGGDPTGAVPVPTLTLHTAADPLVIVANETFFRDRFERRGGGTNLVQVYTVPPRVYPALIGAPYGAGHCVFSDDARIGLISALDGWARDGRYPGPDTLAAQLGPRSGFDAGFQPPPWP